MIHAEQKQLLFIWITFFGFILQVMLEEGIANSTQPLPALKNPEYLARAANRHRQKKRPAEPLDLDFEINGDHLPAGFLQSDLKVNRRRHLVLATKNMLRWLPTVIVQLKLGSI